MRILHLTYSLDSGGLESLILKFFSQINQTKNELHIATLKPDGILERKFNEIGVTVHYLFKDEKVDFKVIFLLKKIIKDHKIEILHTHNTGVWLYGVMTKMLLLGRIKLVHTQHSPFFNENSYLLKMGWIFSFFTDNIISDSNYVSKFLIEKQKIRKHKINLIYNGIDIVNFTNCNDYSLRKELNISNDVKIIGIVARLEPVKNHKVLIDAFMVVKKSIDCVLVIIGDGTLRGELEQYCIKKKIENYVHFLGYRENVSCIIRSLNLFVISSISEGLSLSILEAMAAKVFVIASDVGGNPEVVIDSHTGFHFRNNDYMHLAEKIIYIFNNKDKMEEMVENAYKRVRKHFNINRMSNQYLNIYKGLLLNKSKKFFGNKLFVI